MVKGNKVLHWGPWRKILNELQTCPRCTIHMSLRLCRKPPRVFRNRTRDPSLMEQWPRRRKRAEGLTGGGVAPTRGRRELLAITSRCGSPAMVVGGGRSTRAGGGARRRRGVRPNQGDTVQLNGSGSFTRDQGRCVCKESENGSPDCSV
jgi:hypothetical protein